MKVLRFPLTKITICFVAGIMSCFYLKPELKIAFTFALLAFVGVCFSYYFSNKNRKPTIYFGFSAYLFSFAVGISTLLLHSGYLQQNNYIHQISDSENEVILQMVLREKLKSSITRDRYVAIVKHIDSKQSSGKILVHFDKNVAKKFQIGTNIQVKGNVLKHKKPYNPNQFDYGQYLFNKSIMAQLFAENDQVQISYWVDKDAYYYADQLRTSILKNLKSSIRQEELNVIAALFLGQQQEISAEILRDYQFAGAIHILSVSGLHVGFILLFLTFVLKFVPNRKWTRMGKLLFIIGFLWGFAVLAGLSPSVVRSVTMFSFVAMGLHLRRKTNIFHTLLVSLLLILLFEPAFLFDVGFQLSYVSLFFILWLQPIFSKLWQPENKILQYFWDILTVSFAAQLGAFPLSVYYFHQFPGLFFVTNLIIIPFLSLIMAVGLVVLILAAYYSVPQFLAKTLELSIVVLNKTINWVASFDTFVIQNIPFNKALLLALYLVITTVTLYFIKPNFKRMLIALAAALLLQGVYFITDYQNRNTSEWIVFNARRTSLIAERNGKEITVFSNDAVFDNRTLNSYAVANFCEVIKQEKISNTAYFNDKKILILDSLGLYPEKISPDVLLIRQSPKINLDRLLLTCKPKKIVADASNYKSDVQHWKATCAKQKIPFHAVAEKGFYRLN